MQDKKIKDSRKSAKKEKDEENKDKDAKQDPKPENTKKASDQQFYKGFHRRDVNNMLKEYAQEMYSLGVRNEELLLIKVKPDITSAPVERQYAGGQVTSFFNPDKQEKEKKIDNLVEQLVHLGEVEELKKAREIFTPDEMLRIWNQFFTGSYIVDKKIKKQPDKVDKEDGLEAEYEIINIGDEKEKQDL